MIQRTSAGMTVPDASIFWIKPPTEKRFMTVVTNFGG